MSFLNSSDFKLKDFKTDSCTLISGSADKFLSSFKNSVFKHDYGIRNTRNGFLNKKVTRTETFIRPIKKEAKKGIVKEIKAENIFGLIDDLQDNLLNVSVKLTTKDKRFFKLEGPSVTSIIDTVLDKIDPYQRSKLQNRIRRLIKTIPILDEIETLERTLEIKAYKDIEHHNRLKKEIMGENEDFTEKEATVHALLQTSDIDGIAGYILIEQEKKLKDKKRSK